MNTFIRPKTTQQTGDRLCTAEQHESMKCIGFELNRAPALE